MTRAAKGQTLADSIAECLTINLETGALRPGAVLHTSELARAFNVSRIPVTEAFQKLEREGLIAKRSAQGYAVPGPAEYRMAPSDLVIPRHMADRFDRQPSWERIYERVEKDLVEMMPYGAFRINESSMTAHYGVNRGVIQQVITRLCERGIAEKPSQSNCHLLAYDAAFLRHRFELRAILEPVALGKAAPYLSRAEVQDVLVRHQTLARDFPKGAKAALPRLEARLHTDFLSHCPNSRILVALQGAQVPLITTTRMILRLLGTVVDEPLLAEHIAVLEPLAEGDSDAACDMLRLHLESSAERSIGRLSNLAALPKKEIPAFLRLR